MGRPSRVSKTLYSEHYRGYTIKLQKKYKEDAIYRIYYGTAFVATPSFTVLAAARDWVDNEKNRPVRYGTAD